MPDATRPERPVGRRAVWVEVDLAAIAGNAAVLTSLVAPARLCAVVKDGAYGHGAPPAASAALSGGASWLAVASVEEGAALRDAGLNEPILVLTESAPECMADAVELGLTPTLYSTDGIDAAARAAGAGPSPSPAVVVHLKVDTGMHRVGASPEEAVPLAQAIAGRSELALQGVWTHLATADDVGNPFTDQQVERFDQVLASLDSVGIRPAVTHLANSAGALTRPTARRQLVRCGIALYGVSPSPMIDLPAGIRPALSLRARVSYVKEVAAGEGISYGLNYHLERRSLIATVPVGYADGLPWRLGRTGGQVLIGGRRHPIAGSVTMDQITVDCGDFEVSAGDEVVLLGRQGDEQIHAWEWADRAGTIAYEVLCGIGPRVPRVYG